MVFKPYIIGLNDLLMLVTDLSHFTWRGVPVYLNMLLKWDSSPGCIAGHGCPTLYKLSHSALGIFSH